jgi:hypothetical protein
MGKQWSNRYNFGFDSFGSVWIVYAAYQFGNSVEKLDAYQWFVQPGPPASWSHNLNSLSDSNNIMGGFRGYQSTSNVIQYYGWETTTGVYTVPNSTGSSITLGINMNSNRNTLQSVCLSATRIA